LRFFGVRSLTLVAGLLVGSTGCSWLIGVSEDPVVGDLSVDGAGDGDPDGGLEAAAEDAPLE
jgi:hypothetical protein